MTAMPFVQHDGGRAAAGFRGTTGDCVVRAIAIATGKPYADVYATVAALIPNSPRKGVPPRLTQQIMAHFGLRWTPLMGVGSGCRYHLTAGEVPQGRVIVRLTRHVAAVVDGVLYDSHDSSRNGTRCVYGFWYVPTP